MTPLAYVKLGVMAAGLAALVAGALWIRGIIRERDALKASLATALDANAAQAEAMRVLEAQRAADSAAAAKLAADLRGVTDRERATSRRLADLERTDADVRAYLDRAVPAGLRCVLADAGCGEAGGGEAHAPGGAAGPVRPAQPQAAGKDR